jgi:hypothetical protein
MRSVQTGLCVAVGPGEPLLSDLRMREGRNRWGRAEMRGLLPWGTGCAGCLQNSKG